MNRNKQNGNAFNDYFGKTKNIGVPPKQYSKGKGKRRWEKLSLEYGANT